MPIARNDFDKWQRDGFRMPFGDVPELKFNADACDDGSQGSEEDALREYARAVAPWKALVNTTQPSVPADATLESHPDGWTECFVTVTTKRQIMSMPGFPAPVPRSSLAHAIRATSYAGRGMFATRPIRVGELILAERPLMIKIKDEPIIYHPNTQLDEMPDKIAIMQVMHASGEKTIRRMYNRMPPENQKAYMELTNCHAHDGSGPLVGRARTNGFAIHLGGELHGAVCDQMSKINHSCGPNVQRTFEPRSFSMQIFAMRDIKEGEELTVSYCNPMDPTSERHDSLASYGFTCRCIHCLNPASDARRARIPIEFDSSNWGTKLNMWIDNPAVPDNYLIFETKAALKLMEEEGLQESEYYTTTLMHLCGIYSAIGNEKAYVKYKAKLLRTWIARHGGRVQAFIEIFRDTILPLEGKRSRARAEREKSGMAANEVRSTTVPKDEAQAMMMLTDVMKGMGVSNE